MLKYENYDVTYRDLPNETALSITITSCPFHCKSCHSPQLREDIGTPITEIPQLVAEYKDHISAICLLGHGGKPHTKEVVELLKELKKTHPTLKIGLYSGFDYMFEEFKPYLYYYKVGPYIEELGGLDSPTTNQIMHVLKN